MALLKAKTGFTNTESDTKSDIWNWKFSKDFRKGGGYTTIHDLKKIYMLNIFEHVAVKRKQ